MPYLRENLDALQKLAEEQLGRKSSHEWKEPGNKYDHGIRVSGLAERLRMQIVPDDTTVDPVILTVAAWFHDICNGQEDHENAGADLTASLLTPFGTEEEIHAVCDIIRVHDTRYTAPAVSPFSASVKLLQDADMLDHLGAYDIWITFAEFTHERKTPRRYTDCFHDGSFDRFAAKWRARLNYPFSLTVFDEKIRFEREFAARMERELNGEFC